MLVYFTIRVQGQGNTCSTAITVTPTSSPVVQNLTLVGGNSIWFSFNSNSPIDIIEAFHPDLNQKINQIEVYNNCASLINTISLTNSTFLQRHVKVNASNLVRITWNLPNTAVNIIFQKIATTTNSCMPVPDKIVSSQTSFASTLFQAFDYTIPYSGKILVQANNVLVMDKDIWFNNC